MDDDQGTLLAGVRVVESASLLNGDTLGMLLGDLGADVIKVESPGRGDYLRDFMGQITPHNSPAHLQVNRNKRSIAVDMRSDEGRAVFWRLIDRADVFVDGNAAGAMDRLGVGYDAQRQHNPAIIYASVTGFGVLGPYGTIPTHGMLMTALAGANPVIRADDGYMHPVPPTGLGGTEMGGEATAAAAVHGALRVAAALFARERTGRGRHIDVAGSDAVIAQALAAVIYKLNDARLTERDSLPTIDGGVWKGAKYQFYETRDKRMVILAAIEDKFWANFCEAIDRPDLIASTAASASGVDFGKDETTLRDKLIEVFAARDQREWVQLAATHRFPLGPAPTTLHEMAEDPHIRARSILVEDEHPDAGPFTYVGSAAIIDGQPFRVRRPAPALGQHTAQVLGEFGYSDAEIERLRRANVIGGN
ncbi:CaiB/BaiF CoA-transferase family protein [Mycobacterium colombiense]|uniref:Formyl-CoA transferase n=1 Tax=Mycobacterium colombiense CECT 3035 TaxID=1041522 RepID=J4SHZ9_9MYCO|nr:CaiB/BaiF CoA-transferase family protein [Mycobacterium colombiense]EJO89425.1 Formyl-CoA transferase [Mycobacterium colombiense CECT 3035]